MAYRDFDDDELELLSAESVAPLIDFSNHPVIEVINILAVVLFEILGPFCWSALILLFLLAEFSVD